MAWRALRGSFYSITVSMSGAESSFMTLLFQRCEEREVGGMPSRPLMGRAYV
jgi:hypothetical protein